MLGVKIKIIEYLDDTQPGWIRCVLTDAFGKEWFFTEKIPIVTTKYLDEKSEYPQEGMINCIITNEHVENNFIVIDTSKPYGIYSEDDISNFTIKKSQLSNY